MQPPTSAKPRPPAKRAPSSRILPGFPSPLSRSTSSLNSAPLPSSRLADASRVLHTDQLPETPPLSVDWVLNPLDQEPDGAGRDERVSRVRGALDDSVSSSGGAGGPGFISFPSADEQDATLTSSSVLSTTAGGPPHLSVEVPSSPPAGSATLDAGDEGEEEGAARTMPVLDLSTLKERSREELEKMLEEADRLIKTKEEELSVFTSAGEGLLQEYHHLRDRHDSLLARSTSTGGINSNTSSPKRKSRLSTSSTSATPILPTPTSCAMPKRRSWRTSLGFPPPSGILSSVLPHRRSSNGLSLRRKSGDQNVDPSTPTSPDHSRKSTNAQTTPDTSPIATRHRYASTSSIGSINGPPPPSQLFSPGASGGEVATLGQANYTLTLQLNELEAESERSEREGRKKLRKLERELQAMRDDLERVEQRNAMLEGEAKAVTDLAKSVRISPSHEREETPESTTVSSDQDSTPRYGADDLDWRARMKEELGSDLDGGTSAEHSPVRSFAPSANEDPFSHSTISDFTSSFLSPRRTPGRGFSTYPFTGSRSVSASSLLPLPEPYEFDTTMEEQQDLLVEQLMAKIDELQDANEAIVLEREEMVCRLEEAQEEVEGWKERCEDLEEETVQGRLVGWDGARAAIGWRSDDAGDADSDSSTRVVVKPRKSARRSTLRSSRRRTITNLSRHTSSSPSDLSDSGGDDDETAVSSPPFEDKRSLYSELDGLVSTSAPPANLDDDLNFADTSTLSVIVHPSRAPLDAYDSAEEQEEVESTPTRALPSGFVDESPAPVQHFEDPPEQAVRRRKEKREKRGRKKDKLHLLSSIRFGSEDEGEDGNHDGGDASLSFSFTRRDLALARLDREATSRSLSHTYAYSDSDAGSDTASISSSTYSHMDADPSGGSNDYYPLTLRARYHPKMITQMWSDSAMRHLVTALAWCRFLLVLGIALGFALWQGPKKTLGHSGRKQQRRIR